MVTRLMSAAARSVDATDALVPVLAELFSGIDSLGSSPGLTVRMLRVAGLRAGDRVLDLGCGKGATCLALAKSLGCICLGIDAVAGFTDSAAASAQRQGLSRRCRFLTGDIRAYRSVRRFDAAIMLGLFDIIRARRMLRRHTPSGGVIILDDAVALNSSRRRWLTLDDARVELESQGDVILAEDVWSPERSRRLEARLYARLSANALRLAEVHPQLRSSLAAFLVRQRRAAAMLRGELRPVQWAVRVAGNDRLAASRAAAQSGSAQVKNR
jgi:SAM-dependent methyltransferase